MNTFLRIILASFGLAITVGFLWGTAGLIATVVVEGDVDQVETVGLTGLLLSFFVAAVAFVNGAIVGAISPGDRLFKRLLWHVGVYVVLAIAWSFYITHEMRDLKRLVSKRDYTTFERYIDGRLNEAWAAALIHADPEAMKLCIKHGASAKTWARTDTRLGATQPDEPPVELIVKHRFWSSLVADQQRMAVASLRLLQQTGAGLNSSCIDGGTLTPLQYATGHKLPKLVEALKELGAHP